MDGTVTQHRESEIKNVGIERHEKVKESKDEEADELKPDGTWTERTFEPFVTRTAGKERKKLK
jgi:hypothetical protein